MPTYSRKELYDLVWTESRLSLAKKLGVSDVWIRKACVAADIPVPPQGYWARKAAGKSSVRPALPRRGLGQAETIGLGDDRRGPRRDDEEIEIPPVPAFAETVDEVRTRARAALGRQAVPRGLDRTVPAVQGLLKEDDERRAAKAKDRYYWKEPRFDCPAAQRRLRIINSLLLIVERTGCRGRVGKETLDAHVTVGDTEVTVRLSAVGEKRNDRWDAVMVLTDKLREELVLEVLHADTSNSIPHRWTDSKERKLEQLLGEVAVEILVHGEMNYRAAVLRHWEWLVESKRRREEEMLRRRLEEERKERERQAASERARREHLTSLAACLRQADDIRALVASVGERRDAAELGAWSAWALEIADSLDPRLLPVENVLAP